MRNKIKHCITLIATFLFLSICGTGYCDNGLSYNDTVKLIKELMPNISSNIRKESYGYINFHECILDYNVSGTFPVGTPYDIKYSNIDFSSFNHEVSKVNDSKNDPSNFIIVNFNNSINYVTASNDFPVHTIVIDAASYGQAQTLFKLFKHLGELCSVGKSQLNERSP